VAKGDDECHKENAGGNIGNSQNDSKKKRRAPIAWGTTRKDTTKDKRAGRMTQEARKRTVHNQKKRGDYTISLQEPFTNKGR